MWTSGRARTAQVFDPALVRRAVAAQTEELAIAITGLVKDYASAGKGGAVRAVDGLTLHIPRGSFYGLLGPNGAGKSTTIHVLTGLARATRGDVRILGRDADSDLRRVRRSVGLSPQEPAFDQFLDCREILMYQGMYFEMPRRDATRRADELLARFGLDHKRNHRVQALSGGQRRRLSIAKALMHDPEVLILDEPTAGIDVALRHDLWAYLRELNRDGKTILLTTHYIEEAESLCDRIGIIHGGRLVREGSPAGLMAEGEGDRVVVRTLDPVPDDWGGPAMDEGELTRLADGMTVVAMGGRAGRMASQVISGLGEIGVRVDGIEIKRRSLEQAFVQAVGGEIAPDGSIATVGNAARGGNV